jgi:hypothetical protein
VRFYRDRIDGWASCHPSALRSPAPPAPPDPRELPPKGLRTRDIYVPDLHIDTIKVKGRNFH